MRHLSRTLLAPLFALLALAAACGDDSSYSGGDNNATAGTQGYLQPCEASAECADDLTCDAGVCTRACQLNAECEAEGVQAICLPSDDASGASTCQPHPRECPDQNVPVCEPGEELVNHHDADGCSHPVCEPVECESLNNGITCPPGQHLASSTDDRGCNVLTCEPDTQDCPVYNQPICGEGQEVVLLTDDDGCTYPECQNITCPDIALPPEDFCPEGQHLVTVQDQRGCDMFACAPDDPEECPPIAAPSLDFCAFGERIIQVTNDNGCPSFACTAEGCEGAESPEICFDGEPPSRRTTDANGCIIGECDAERSFPCGNARSCLFDTEYCDIVVPGVQGAETTFSCTPMPDTCLASPSCECLADAGAWSENAGSCQDGGGPPGSATLTVTLFAP